MTRCDGLYLSPEQEEQNHADQITCDRGLAELGECRSERRRCALRAVEAERRADGHAAARRREQGAQLLFELLVVDVDHPAVHTGALPEAPPDWLEEQVACLEKLDEPLDAFALMLTLGFSR